MSDIYRRSRAKNNNIQPFWNMIPSFFLYTLSPLPLILCAIIAALSAILPSLFIYVCVYSLITKYSFEVLIRTSEGDMTPPGFTGDVLNANYDLVLKQIGIYFFFGAMIGTFYNKGLDVLATLASIFFLLLMPAMTMVLASTNSFLDAINPRLLIGMVLRVGWSYLGLYGLLFIVYMAETNMQGLLQAKVGSEMIFPIFNAINLFFSVLAYHMMGYLLYQHHEMLGIDQRVSNEEEPDITESKLDLFYSYMDRNMVEAAQAELLGLARDDPSDTKLLQKLCTFLLAHGTDEDKLRYSRNIIPILLNTERANVAAMIYMDLIADHPDFTLKQADHYMKLSRALYAMGRDRNALNLIQNLHKRFPKTAEVADTYIEAAEILSHKFSRDDTALKMLMFVVKSFPQHPRRREALHLVKTIQKLASA